MDHDRQLELLRTYEPVIRYTKGELFFPTSVADYVDSSTLYISLGRREASALAEPGDLTLDELAAAGRRYTEAELYLQQVEAPLGRRDFRQWRKDPDRPRFKASSRFAAVGLLSRFIDSLMRLTLLLRGRVPGGFAAAAQRDYAATAHHDQCYYYGRVVSDGGYLALQYWFFYSMNDWRSTFGGVNDHEADWEQVTIFLADRGPDTEPTPAWVAFSSHDEVGDDLRRRWDDPDIEFVDGTHPVVYAGAGSHSGAYLPGEYLITAPIPLPDWILTVRNAVVKVLPGRDRGSGTIGIPYIDYRRGDGLVVGPAGDRPWHPVVIDDETPWVRDYRGLWGLDTGDPLGGERAPAGPRYERNRTVRASWLQPVAWAGLDKEAPTDAKAMARMAQEEAATLERLAEVNAELESAREGLRAARATDRAMGRPPTEPAPLVVSRQHEVDQLRRSQRALQRSLEEVQQALHGPLPADEVHAHLHHRSLPMSAKTDSRGRLLRLWSAASTSVVLGSLGVLLLLGESALLWPFLAITAGVVVVEALLRGRLGHLLVWVLAFVLGAIVLLVVSLIVAGNLRHGLGVVLVCASLYMAVQTIREGLATR